jgi:peptidoglycan hydrolase-like amidase
VRKKILIFCSIATLLASVFGLQLPVFGLSAECDQAASNISPDRWETCRLEYEREAAALSQANATNKDELANLEKQLSNLKQKVQSLSQQLTKLEADIKTREVDLGLQQELLGVRIRSYYIRSRYNSPFLLLLSSRTASNLTRELALRETVTNQDKAAILSISSQISKLKSDKDAVAKNKISLASLQKTVDDRASFLAKEIGKTETYLATLNAKQQAVLALKSGGFSTSVGDVPLADDPASRPDFNPGFSPAFAAFSFGAPHRKGMSQYGAYGRAKLGQSAEQILTAYYGSGLELKKDYSTGINIKVSGYGTVDIETYTKRIYEMPASWGDSGGFEALKAQAVAARSYALAYTNNGAGSICATESCQVYKPSNKGGKWDEAVNATRGWVLVKNGQPFSSMYASTAGGYTFSYTSQGQTTPGLWDTPSGRGGWTDQAYEKTANSPWFYKAWYRERSGATCGGKSNPWLTSADMADILNAWKVLYQGGGDTGRILPPDNCGGGSPYSKSELQSIGGFTDVSGVTSVVYGDSGSTLSIGLSTNKGNITINGEEFKRAFNLRAPGYIGIKSSLFNLVKK